MRRGGKARGQRKTSCESRRPTCAKPQQKTRREAEPNDTKGTLELHLGSLSLLLRCVRLTNDETGVELIQFQSDRRTLSEAPLLEMRTHGGNGK